MKTKIEALLASEVDIAIRQRARSILLGLDLHAGDKILDAGCGPGYNLNLLVQLGVPKMEIYGVDLDKVAIDQLKKKYSPAQVKAVNGNLENMTFKANFFDKAILSEVAEHVVDEKLILKNIYKVLKPGGYLLVTVPNHYYPFFWDPVNWTLEHFLATHVRTGFWAGIWTNHLRLYTPKQITEVIKAAGFKIGEVEALTPWCLPFNKNLLYGGKLPKNWSKSLLADLNSQHKPVLVQLMLWIVNIFDRINSNIHSQNMGVSVFIKAYK